MIKKLSFVSLVAGAVGFFSACHASPVSTLTEDGVEIRLNRIVDASQFINVPNPLYQDGSSAPLTRAMHFWYIEASAWERYANTTTLVETRNITYQALEESVSLAWTFANPPGAFITVIAPQGKHIYLTNGNEGEYGGALKFTTSEDLTVSTLQAERGIFLEAHTLFVNRPKLSSASNITLNAHDKLFCRTSYANEDPSILPQYVHTSGGGILLTSYKDAVMSYGCHYAAGKEVAFKGRDLLFDGVLYQDVNVGINVALTQVSAQGLVTVTAAHDVLMRGFMLRTKNSTLAINAENYCYLRGCTFWGDVNLNATHTSFESSIDIMNALVNGIPIGYEPLRLRMDNPANS